MSFPISLSNSGGGKWDYRTPIVLTNSGSALTDYQIFFSTLTAHLGSLILARMDGGLADVRFTDDGGTELDYWYNSADDVIWVKVNTIASSSETTIYMYYGNSSATSSSSESDTFIFFDDFNTLDLTKWNKDSGGWAATTFDGKSCVYIEPGSNNQYLRAKNTSIDDSSNWVIEYSMYSTQAGDSYAHIGASFYGASGYNDHIFFRPQGGTNAIQYAYFNGSLISVQNWSPATYGWNAWHDIKLILKGSSVDIYVDGGFKATRTGFQYDGVYDNIGLVAQSGGKTYWDNIRVRKYSSSEPTLELRSVETSDNLRPINGRCPVPDNANMEVVLHCDEDVNPTVDSSGNGRDGDLESAGHPKFSSNGKFGGCFDFDGSQDFIELPTFSMNNFTIGCWINLVSHEDHGEIIVRPYNVGWTAPHAVFQIQFNAATNQLRGHITISGTLYEIAIAEAIPENIWVWIVMRYNGTDSDIYINGQKCSKTVDAIPGGSLDNGTGVGISIGGRGTTTVKAEYVEGKIDDVFITNDVWVDEKILAYYLQQVGGGK